MADFKNQKAAVEWLSGVNGVYLEEASQDGKWAAYVPPKNSDDDMIIGYGDTVLLAITEVSSRI